MKTHPMETRPRGRRVAPPGPQAGAGLLEVMISILIMGIGLLGIAAMQATALRNSQSSLERSQAVIQTYTILESMRANRAAALAGEYNLVQTCDPPAANATLAQSDIRAWISSLEQTLGNTATTCGTIACNGADCTVTVQWDDSRGTDNAGAGSTTYRVATRTQL
ncbi:type IV pilus modification protein PilV [Pseudoxanthomonas sp. J35]|uniref:type IV pilus modification protein PilV n=1 Tax=Pseudoxanthomonas sp. J35 TaxID=935852 RepID=UPI0004ACC80D|nr:type IV pilus modification protein PilV [Pseudoxanthomonas sp. J35]